MELPLPSLLMALQPRNQGIQHHIEHMITTPVIANRRGAIIENEKVARSIEQNLLGQTQCIKKDSRNQKLQ